MSFHPGQRVVCVSTFTNIPPGANVPDVGKIYTVRSRRLDIGVGFDEPVEGLTLVEIVNGIAPCGLEWAFYSGRFRPLDESRLDQFRIHLAPIKQREEA